MFRISSFTGNITADNEIKKITKHPVALERLHPQGGKPQGAGTEGNALSHAKILEIIPDSAVFVLPSRPVPG
jgi:hypothetical protein